MVDCTVNIKTLAERRQSHVFSLIYVAILINSLWYRVVNYYFMNVDAKLIVIIIIILIFVWTAAFTIVYFVIFVRFTCMLNFTSYSLGNFGIFYVPFACKLSFFDIKW